MLVTDLPTLLPSDYPAANCLRQEIRRALDYKASFPNSGAAVTAFFSALGASSLPSSQVVVSDTGAVSVLNSAGADVHAAVASVSGGVLAGVKLAATAALVDQADSIAIQNSAGTVVGAAGAVTVAAGVATAVKLPAASAIIPTGTKLPVAATGTGTFVTVTVANGVVTAVVLSAS